jgi:hypothetical protein
MANRSPVVECSVGGLVLEDLFSSQQRYGILGIIGL